MRTAILLGLALPATLVAQIQRPSRIGTPIVAEPRAPVLTAVPTAPNPSAPAADPSGFTATRLGNTVLLSWQAVPGVSWYLLGGPGMTLYGQQVQGTSYTLRDLAPGHYEWSVASLAGENQPALNNGALWPKASLVLDGRTVGAYRISVAGFRVDRTTYDDQLNRDGASDEVYASVIFQRFDRTGTLVQSGAVTSKTHGDASKWPTRVAQGGATAEGGLAPRDVVPFGWDERSVQPPLVADPRRFPMVVWQGMLADSGDVLVLRPSLWEEDGDATAFNFYTRYLAGAPPAATWGLEGFQQSLTNTEIQPSPGISGPERKWLLRSWSFNVVDYLAVDNSRDFYINPGRDRPIGLRTYGGEYLWYDQVFGLTREKLEAELRRASAIGAPAGVIALRLSEKQGGVVPLNGDYVLYLRVERM
jgi:hypothetical protein